MNDKEILSYVDRISHRVDDLEKRVENNSIGPARSDQAYDDINIIISIGLFVVGAVLVFAITRRVSLVLVVAAICAIGYIVGTINKKQN